MRKYPIRKGEASIVWEFSILNWIQETLRSPAADWFMVTFSSLGNWGFLWILICAALLISKKHRRWGIILLCALTLSLLLGELALKNLIERPRPCTVNTDMVLLIPRPISFSFPSGHSASSFCAASVLWRWNRRAGAAAFLIATAIAVSRMYLYVHFPTDVLAGALLGVGCAYLVCRLFRRRWPELFARKPI